VRKPTHIALSWLARAAAGQSVDALFRAQGFVPGSKHAAEAIGLAFRLVREELDETEAVARLAAARGGRKALKNAAEMQARYANDGYPYGPVYRLLRAASGEPVPPPSSVETAAEARNRQLELQPLSTSFDELAEQVRDCGSWSSGSEMLQRTSFTTSPRPTSRCWAERFPTLIHRVARC
jgi:hypothetical protein